MGQINIFAKSSISRRIPRSAMIGFLLATSAATPALAQSVTNPGFENGDTGWTKNGGIWNGGWPIDPNGITGAPTLVSVQSAGTDAVTGAQLVFEGSKSIKINDGGGGRDVNVIRQTVIGYDDGQGTVAGANTSLYFAWNAVLQPSHGATDSPNFTILVKDLTAGSTVLNIAYSAFSAQSALDGAGNPLFRSVNGFVTSDWKVENVSVVQGHDYELIFLAADCDAGGHGGYVYLDGFGGTIPTANANVLYNISTNPNGFDPAVDITQGASLVTPISNTPDIVTPSGNTVSGLGTVTTRRFNGGTLTAANDSGNFTIAAAGGVIDSTGTTATFSGTFANDGSDIGKLTIKNTGAANQGKVILTGANTHSGGTRVEAGAVLEIQSAAALGTGALSLIGTPTVAASLSLTGNTTITNSIFVAGDPIINVASGVTTTISGVIADDQTGPGDIEKTGTGTLVLSGLNTYSAGTIVTGGILRAGAVNTIPLGRAVSVGAAGTLDLAGYNQSISTLSGSGVVTLGSAALVLTAASSTFSGAIGGTGNLTVAGGLETLTGINSYTGGTIIRSGATLQLGAGGTTGSIVGNVANDGRLVVDRSNDLTMAGVISGTGTLTKTGAGVLTLTGANTYSGGTTVSAGGLKGDTTSLQGAIANNAAVEFAQSTDGTYAGVMTGTGTLAKTGAGIVTLTGANTYSGGTTVSAGGLKGDSTSLQGAIANNGSVEFAQAAAGTYIGVMSGTGTLSKTGAGTLTLTGANTYSGGTTVSAGRLAGSAASLQGAIANSAVVEFNQAAAGTYAGVMSGAGQLIKTGTGTLTLTGANTYTGGTTVSAGRVTGNTTSLQGAIANSGQVEFAQATAGTFAGVISGTGQLIKTDAGTLTLTGANTYSGGTLVSAGRLTGNTVSLQGLIANNAAVEFNQAAAGTYAGTMVGSGQFTKSGAGALTLSGASSITGGADVAAGTLVVNGTLAAGGLAVRTGATLGGTGAVGGNVTVENGATLAPGNSPGTLTVAGDVIFAAGSNFVPEIDGRTYNAAGGAGTFDRLVLSGTATLGGTIAPRLRAITGTASNSFTPRIGDAFTVITAASVVGSFAGITQPVDGLAANTRFDVLYRPANVTLILTPGSYGVLGLTGDWNENATNAGFGIDRIRPAAGTRGGAQQGLFDGLYGLDSDQLRRAVTQLSGEAYSHALQSLTRTERAVMAEVIEASCEMGCNGPGITTDEALWIRYVGDYANHGADMLSSGYRNRSHGVVGGVTLVSSNTVKFGLAGSYSEDDVTSELNGKSQMQTGGGYLYLHYLPTDRLALSGALGVTTAQTQTTREVDTIMGKVIASSKRKSSSLLFAAQASYRTWGKGAVSLWTDLGLEFGNTKMDRIRESASIEDYALTMTKVKRTAGQTVLGGRLQLASGDLQAALTAGWVYQLGAHPSAIRGVELGDARWTVSGVNLARSGVRVGVQAGAKLSDRISLFGTFQHTQQGRGYQYNQASGGLRIAM